MKFTKSEILFILYVVLAVANTIGGLFNESYQQKLEGILQKLAVLTDMETKNENK